jgi:hypothetical protein
VSVWVANISTAITTIVILLGFGRQYIVKPFQRYISDQIVLELRKLNINVQETTAKVVELQEQTHEQTGRD